jgi:hypothetical protein
VRFAQLPELHAQREQAAGDARGELLRTRVQRYVANGLRGGLDDAGRGLASMSLAMETMQSPLITLSASSTTM